MLTHVLAYLSGALSAGLILAAINGWMRLEAEFERDFGTPTQPDEP